MYPKEGRLAAGQQPARIDLSFATGTNLREKWLEVRATSASSDVCSNPAQTLNPTGSPEVVSINALEFKRQSFGQGAAGNLYDGVAYATAKGGSCVVLTFTLHSVQAANFATPIPTFDRPTESAIFDQIVTTLRWTQ